MVLVDGGRILCVTLKLEGRKQWKLWNMSGHEWNARMKIRRAKKGMKAKTKNSHERREEHRHFWITMSWDTFVVLMNPPPIKHSEFTVQPPLFHSSTSPCIILYRNSQECDTGHHMSRFTNAEDQKLAYFLRICCLERAAVPSSGHDSRLHNLSHQHSAQIGFTWIDGSPHVHVRDKELIIITAKLKI